MLESDCEMNIREKDPDCKFSFPNTKPYCFHLKPDKGFQDLTNDREFFIQSTTGIMCMKTPSLWTKSYVWCYHSNETSSAVLSHGTIYLVCSSNF